MGHWSPEPARKGLKWYVPTVASLHDRAGEEEGVRHGTAPQPRKRASGVGTGDAHGQIAFGFFQAKYR